MATRCSGVHIIKDGRLLLKYAGRGISKGYWNFLGGKIESWENPEQSAVREAFEETGLRIRNLKQYAVLNFYLQGRKGIDFIVYFYATSSFSGKPRGTDEGRLRWFDIGNIPYDRMWDDDKYWMQLFFEGRKFIGDFYFDRANRRPLRYSIRFVKKL